MTGASPMLMAAIGDSMAYGRDDPNPEGGWYGWVPRLATLLGIRSEQVHNVAEEGALLADMARKQLSYALEPKPLLLVYCCGMNDTLAATAPEDTEHHLTEIFTTCRDADVFIATVSTAPRWDGVPLSRVRRSRMQQTLQTINGQLHDLADKHAAICVDGASIPRADEPESWAADGLHLSPLGHASIAAALADAIRPRLPIATQAHIGLGLGWPQG